MSRDRADLVADFAAQMEAVQAACKARGVDMRPFFTARHPVEQGGLWRQSRSGSEVRAKIASLIGAGAPYLAQCIVDAGSQSGRWATNAIPGLSWHQWGLAEDDYWLVDGKAEWNADAIHNGVNGYAVYAEEAERLGLRSLRSIGDSPHVQQPKEGSPSSMGLVAVDAAMRERWGA